MDPIFARRNFVKKICELEKEVLAEKEKELEAYKEKNKVLLQKLGKLEKALVEKEERLEEL